MVDLCLLVAIAHASGVELSVDIVIAEADLIKYFAGNSCHECQDQHQGRGTCHKWQDHLFNNGDAVYRRRAGSATAAGRYSSTSHPWLSFPVSSYGWVRKQARIVPPSGLGITPYLRNLSVPPLTYLRADRKMFPTHHLPSLIRYGPIYGHYLHRAALRKVLEHRL